MMSGKRSAEPSPESIARADRQRLAAEEGARAMADVERQGRELGRPCRSPQRPNARSDFEDHGLIDRFKPEDMIFGKLAAIRPSARPLGFEGRLRQQSGLALRYPELADQPPHSCLQSAQTCKALSYFPHEVR
jgi:hypothetical protein